MEKHKIFLLLFAIVIIASFLRLYQITELPPGLYPDEAMNGNNALEALRTGDYKVYYPENNGREGLFINIQAQFLNFLGAREPWVLRLPSAVFGIITVLGLYFLAKELFSKRVALLSSFLLATSFWHIMFSRIGFRAIMAPMLLILGVYFLLLSVRQAHEGNRNKSNLSAVIGGVIFGLGFYTYIAYRVMPFLLLTLIPFFRKQNGFWKVVLIFLTATFIVGLPIGIYYLQNPADFLGRTSQVSIFSSPTPVKDLTLNIVTTMGMFNFVGDGNSRHNFAGRPELFWPVGIMFVIGIILAIQHLTKKRELYSIVPEFPTILVFLWFGLAALPVVTSNEGLPHALRAILMLPPAIILAGIGGVWIYEFLEKHLNASFLRISASIFLILLAFEAYTTYFILWGKDTNTPGAFSADYVEIGRKINDLPIDMPKYILVRAGGVDVRGVPMPTQTVMFMTDTFLPINQELRNVYYISPDTVIHVPSGAPMFYLK
jgi:4-amino-4-deoxy-L-arabinose transferase-like glycosyltransferase